MSLERALCYLLALCCDWPISLSFLIFYTVFEVDDGQRVQSSQSRTIQTNFIAENACFVSMNVFRELSEDKLTVPFLLLCYGRLLTQNQLYLFSLADMNEKGVVETDLESVSNCDLE